MLGGATLLSNTAVGNPDLLAISGAVLGFALGVALVRLHAWLHRFDKSLQPTLMEFVNSSVEVVNVR